MSRTKETTILGQTNAALKILILSFCFCELSSENRVNISTDFPWEIFCEKQFVSTRAHS